MGKVDGMKYLVLGAGGMAGHIICQYLTECGQSVEGVARRELDFCKTHVMDVTCFDKLKDLIEHGGYDIVINCVGILNRTAEENIDLAVLINSYLPHFLVRVTKDIPTRVFHISTDCVFSGKTGGYSELSTPDGESYYARTKALGEIRDDKNLTFRTSIIGPDINSKGIGLFHWFMHQECAISGYEKSIWTGVTTLTLAKALYRASFTGITGLYNLVNNEVINKYELLCLFNRCMSKGLTINKVDGVAHDKSLVKTREDFDFVVPSYEEQIFEMRQWIKDHPTLYQY